MGIACLARAPRRLPRPSPEEQSNTVSSSDNSPAQPTKPCAPYVFSCALPLITQRPIYELGKFLLEVGLVGHREFSYSDCLQTGSANSLHVVRPTQPLLMKVPPLSAPLKTVPRQMRKCGPIEKTYWGQGGSQVYINGLQAYFFESFPPASLPPSRALLVSLESGKPPSFRRYCLDAPNEFQRDYSQVAKEKKKVSFQSTLFSGEVLYEDTLPVHSLLRVLGVPEGDPFCLEQVWVVLHPNLTYPDKPLPQEKHPISLKHLRTYFQISNYMESRFGGFFSMATNQVLSDPSVELLAYIAVQSMLQELEQCEGQSDRTKMSLIQEFMGLSARTLARMDSLLSVVFTLQGCSAQQVKTLVRKVISASYQQVEVVADGLFLELCLEINEEAHPFRKDHLCFTHKISTISFLSKQGMQVRSNLAAIFIHHLQRVTLVDKPTLKIIDSAQLSFYKEFNTNVSREGIMDKDSLVYEDCAMRMKLFKALLFLETDPHLARMLVGQIVKHVSRAKYVSGEVMVTVFSLAGVLCELPGEGFRNTAEWYFLKSIEVAHRMYGDPRATRHFGRGINQAWELLPLCHLSEYFRKEGKSKELSVLVNLVDCLKEDCQCSAGVIEDPLWRFRAAPIGIVSGVYYCRSSFEEDADKKSTYSEFYERKSRVATPFLSSWESAAKITQFSGVIHWGLGANRGPSVFAPLKNRQALAIASGNYHTVVLCGDGIYGWGEGQSGQLGIHNRHRKALTDLSLIQQVIVDRNRDQYQLSCGNQHTAVLLNGVLMMWGQEGSCLLGGIRFKFDYICCGGLHTLGILNGVVYSWGRGEGGQLGHPIEVLKRKEREETTQFYIDRPLAIAGIGNAVKVACGDAHSLVLTGEGEVYVFGFSYQGQLGLGITGESEKFQIFEPIKLLFFGSARVQDISAGPTFSFFSTEEKEVFSCGLNDYLQLGIDRVMKVLSKKTFIERVQVKKKVGEAEFSVPRKISMFSRESKFGLEVTHIECGQNHCLASVTYLGKEPMIMGWGLNRHFQVGAEFTQTTAPRTIDSLFGLNVLQVCCASNQTFAIVGSPSINLDELERSIDSRLKSQPPIISSCSSQSCLFQLAGNN